MLPEFLVGWVGNLASRAFELLVHQVDFLNGISQVLFLLLELICLFLLLLLLLLFLFLLLRLLLLLFALFLLFIFLFVGTLVVGNLNFFNTLLQIHRPDFLKSLEVFFHDCLEYLDLAFYLVGHLRDRPVEWRINRQNQLAILLNHLLNFHLWQSIYRYQVTFKSAAASIHRYMSIKFSSGPF